VLRDGSSDVVGDTGTPMFTLSVKCGITTPEPTPVPTPPPTPVPTFEFVTRMDINSVMRLEFATPSDFSPAAAMAAFKSAFADVIGYTRPDSVVINSVVAAPGACSEVLPSPAPTHAPTPSPSPDPTGHPSPQPTPHPSVSFDPTGHPTQQPSPDPTSTHEPSPDPTVFPTRAPTLEPTKHPFPGPTVSPLPSEGPLPPPTPAPVLRPTQAPTSWPPSATPTVSNAPTACGDYFITMSDSFGDGWHGTRLHVGDHRFSIELPPGTSYYG